MYTDVKALLLGAVARNTPQHFADVTTAVHVDPDLHHFLLDPAKVNEILDILLSNAGQAVGERGQIEVRARMVDAAAAGSFSGSRPNYVAARSESASGRFLEISVSDAGVGIVATELVEIFLPLRRVAHTPHRRFDGHGVGLTTVKLLMEAQGGAVGVESVVSEGSTFTIWLPYREAPLASSTQSRSISSRSKTHAEHQFSRMAE